ncbi:MAG TPA: polysaccharide biosynthesis/export family protein [Planctomycetota bacterium]
MKRILPVLCFLSACSAPDAAPRTSKEPPSQSFIPSAAPTGVPAIPIPANLPAPDPLLLAGDLLHIAVFRQPEMDLEVRIPTDGSIAFPLIGGVQAAAKTSGHLEQEIRRRLEKDYLHEAHVTVTVKEFAKRRVYIVGAVTKPGGYEIYPHQRMTILQAVAAAEGFTDRAYKEYVQVVRRRGPTEREVIRLSLVEVERMLARGRAEADLELWPDDLVVIPSAVRVAYVLGAVNKPGNLEVPNDARITVSMAVSQAGSYTKFAATGRVQVLRQMPGGETQKIGVDLDAVLNGQLELDIPLLPGDVVWVPERGIF